MTVQGGQHTAFVKQSREIAQKTFEITLEIPGGDVDFAAGQYVWISLKNPQFPDNRGNLRAFSICSSPSQKNEIKIAFRDSDSNFKKSLVGLAIGDEIEVSPPFGNLVLPEDPLLPVLLIAGGIGITPFMSMLEWECENKSERPITLIYANEQPERAAYIKEIRALLEANPNFKARQVHGKVEWKHFSKFIDKSQIYLSGPPIMVDALAKLLEKNKVSTNAIHYEEFYSSEVDKIRSGIPAEEFRLAVESSWNHIILTDTNGMIIYANHAAETITGYSFQEMVGHTPRLWGGLMGANFYKTLWKTIKFDKKPFFAEVNNRRKSGENYLAVLRIAPIFNQKDELTGFIGAEEDVSALRDSQKRLESQDQIIAQENAKNEAILATVEEAVIVTNSRGKIILCNQSAERILGKESKEIMNKPAALISPFLNSKGKLTRPHPVNQCLELSAPVMLTAGFLRLAKNSDKAIEWTVSPLIIKNKAIGAILVFRDLAAMSKAEQVGTELIASVSEQLQPPLASIAQNSHTLLKEMGSGLSKQMRDLLEQIEISTLLTSETIDNLLNLAKLDTGTLAVKSEKVNLTILVNDTIRKFENLVAFKEIELKKDFTNLPVVSSDSGLLGLILQNLLSNALKYTPEGGSVRLKIRVEDKYMEIEVSDNGIGIPVNDQTRIFDKLFQGSNTKAWVEEGNGIGLYLTQAVVEQLDGVIAFQSPNTDGGNGTAFRVKLPIKKSPVFLRFG